MTIRFVRPLLLSLLCACPSAHAQEYPNKPILIINGNAPGGSGDLVARIVGAKLTEAWGQQVVLEHRPGANGSIGYVTARSRPADGYNLFIGNNSQVAPAPLLFPNLEFYEKDFDPVVSGVSIEYILAVNPTVPVQSLQELIRHLKANRGKLNYAHLGTGSIHQLSMEMLKRVAGLDVSDVVGVAYKGSGQYLTDLVGGQVQLAYQGIPQTMAYVSTGQLKAVALGSSRRLAAAPGVPTIAETFPGFETNSSWDFYTPKGTPRDIVMKLNAEITKILEMPDVRDRLVAQGMYPSGGSPEALAARLRADYNKWSTLVRDLGLKL
jgi:tripartite-type tricarboxylate transporter receptor subunit TctC